MFQREPDCADHLTEMGHQLDCDGGKELLVITATTFTSVEEAGT